ncbi:MAG: hypothetical protein Q7R56_03295, partial [Nanoarchaeota archaeon]|nr:hypothetical protein [Nanoarchaeota archaeon]
LKKDLACLKVTELEEKYGLLHVALGNEVKRRGFGDKPVVALGVQTFRGVPTWMLRKEANTLTMVELVDRYKISWPTIRAEFTRRGFRKPLVIKNKTREITEQQRLRESFVLEGYTLEEIAERERLVTGKEISPQAVHIYLVRSGLQELWYEAKLEKKRKDDSRIISVRSKEVASLLNKGMTPAETARELNVSKQRVSQIIARDGWVQNTTRRNFLYTSIANLTGKISDCLWLDMPLEEQYTWRYMTKTSTIPGGPLVVRHVEKLKNLFREYEQVRESGDKVTLEQFATKVGFTTGSVMRVLNEVGLPIVSYWGNITQRATQVIQNLKRRMAETYERTVFTQPDIAYFLKRDRIIVRLLVGGKEIVKKKGDYSWRDASLILESKDVGFSVDETCQISGKDMNLVERVLDQQERIEEKVIPALRLLSNDNSLTTPYIPTSVRRSLDAELVYFAV